MFQSSISTFRPLKGPVGNIIFVKNTASQKHSNFIPFEIKSCDLCYMYLLFSPPRIYRKLLRKPSTNSSLSLSSSPSTTTKQPKSLMTIIKGGHKSSVFSTAAASPSTKSKSIRHEGSNLTKEECELQHASLP